MLAVPAATSILGIAGAPATAPSISAYASLSLGLVLTGTTVTADPSSVPIHTAFPCATYATPAAAAVASVCARTTLVFPRAAMAPLNPRVALPIFIPINSISTVTAAAPLLSRHAAVLVVIGVRLSNVVATASFRPRAVASSFDRWRQRRSTRRRAHLPMHPSLPLSSASVVVSSPLPRRRTAVSSSPVAVARMVFVAAGCLVFALVILAVQLVIAPVPATLLTTVSVAGVGFSAAVCAVGVVVATAGIAAAFRVTAVVTLRFPWRSRTRVSLSTTDRFRSVPAVGDLSTRV